MVIRRMLVRFVLLMTGSVVLADSWSPISTVDVPTARAAHSAVFTRIDGTDQMIVWGGQDSPMVPFADTGSSLEALDERLGGHDDDQRAVWAPGPPGGLDRT